jgi:hypothetical protein
LINLAKATAKSAVAIIGRPAATIGVKARANNVAEIANK